MPVKSGRAWSGLLVGLLSVFAFSATAAGSIMDIINMEKVEKLIAERRENGTPEDSDRRFLTQNTIDVDETFPVGGDDDDDEGATDDDMMESDSVQYGKRNRNKFNSNNVHRGKYHRNHRNNFTGVPDFATVLADLTGFKPDKILKSDNNPVLITRKEYLKKDWCKTEPMVQKIREEGCLTRTVLNRFCYGQCNSFYIPKNPPRRKRNRKRPFGDEETDENLTFRSCGFCKPKRSSWIIVTLRCPGLVPRFKKKKVHRIKQCKCIAENVGL